MKKRQVFLITAGAVIAWAIVICVVVNIKPIAGYVGRQVVELICMEFDREEQQRIKDIEAGKLVRGKDTVLIWENKYEIGHYSDSDYLEIHEDGFCYSILHGVKDQKVSRKKLYVLSDEGYAVIDKNNLCRVCVTVPDDEFVNGYTVDDAGNEIPISRYIENENVIYLKSYSEFTGEERKVFEKMEK